MDNHSISLGLSNYQKIIGTTTCTLYWKYIHVRIQRDSINRSKSLIQTEKTSKGSLVYFKQQQVAPATVYQNNQEAHTYINRYYVQSLGTLLSFTNNDDLTNRSRCIIIFKKNKRKENWSNSSSTPKTKYASG